MKRNAAAIWQGDIKRGSGQISTESGALKTAADNARSGCPVSKLFKAPITMETWLNA